MKILFVIHEFSLTGAPILGLKIAELLSAHHQVFLVSKSGGPLKKVINKSKFVKVIELDSHHSKKVNLNTRVANAIVYINEFKPDLVFVNSIAAADWVTAAKFKNIPAVLYLHEMRDIILALRASSAYNPADIDYCSFVFVAAEKAGKDFCDVFGGIEDNIVNIGVGVDYAEIVEKSKVEILESVPRNSFGDPLDININKNNYIAMCGTGEFRKGVDIFWNIANLLPQKNFLWIGPWDDMSNPRINLALEKNKNKPLKNLFWTNSLVNPYPYIANCSTFILTSREDPNPLVVVESIMLGKKVLVFSGTGSSWEIVSRFGLCFSGKISENRLVKGLEVFDADQISDDGNSEAKFYDYSTSKIIDTLNVYIERFENFSAVH